MASRRIQRIDAGKLPFSPDLLWQLERADARNALACADARAALFDFKAEYRWIAGGYGIYAGHRTHLTQGIGIGVSGPVRSKDVAVLVKYFVSRLTVPTVHVSEKLAAALRTLNAFGFREAGQWMVLARRLRRAHHSELLSGTVDLPKDHERSGWIRAASQGFANRDDIEADDVEVGSIAISARDTTALLVRDREEIMGTAALVCRSGVAVFFADSTRLKFRGRGLQSALIAARIRIAAESGCHLATACALENSASERNYLRMGFARLYKRIILQYGP